MYQEKEKQRKLKRQEFNANKEIYIKRNNYFFDKDDLKLKIKNVDRILLASNLVFYKIKR